MCLTCACMDAHLEVGENNIRYEDLKQAAEENCRSVNEILAVMDLTVTKDRTDHPEEYAQSPP